MNYDFFLLITVKQKWQLLIIDVLVSFQLVVPLSVRASEFFFPCRRQKRKEIICEKHIHSLESYAVKGNELITSHSDGGKNVTWPRTDSRSPGVGNGNQLLAWEVPWTEEAVRL